MGSLTYFPFEIIFRQMIPDNEIQEKLSIDFAFDPSVEKPVDEQEDQDEEEEDDEEDGDEEG